MKHQEDSLQIACITWMRLQYPDVTVFSIPNGGRRDVKEAAKLKRTGVLAGVADLFVMRAGSFNREHKVINEGTYFVTENYPGLWVELKVGKNKQTDNQVWFSLKAQKEGYAYKICSSIDDFMKTVNEYLQP